MQASRRHSRGVTWIPHVALGPCDHVCVVVRAYCFQNLQSFWKPNKHKQISFLWDHDQGSGKTITRRKIFRSTSSCSEKLFGVSFSGWIDNRKCCPLRFFLRGGEHYSSQRKKAEILLMCCIRNQTDIHRRTFPKIWLCSQWNTLLKCLVGLLEMDFYFISLQVSMSRSTDSIPPCWCVYVSTSRSSAFSKLPVVCSASLRT